MDINQFVSQVNGKYFDLDGLYGSQCVDLVNYYSKWIWPGVSPWATLGGGNAKDIFYNASNDYYTKIVNDVNDANQVPDPGDIVCFAATATNPYGHIAVVITPIAGGLRVIQQDGTINVDANGNARGTAFIDNRPWGRSRCIGWLRPKYPSAPAPAPVPVTSGAHTVTLPKSVQRWRVYPLNKAPLIGHEVGFLTPAAIGRDLEYDILGNPYSNVYTIQTQSYGKVNIYAGPDTDAILR